MIKFHKKISWRGIGMFVLIYYLFILTNMWCGAWTALSFGVCVIFLLCLRPLILGKGRQDFYEAKRTHIPSSEPRRQSFSTYTEDDDLP